jgi:ferredoxin
MIARVDTKNPKLSRQKLGRFFIDQHCAGCRNCFSLAPGNIGFLSMVQRCSIIYQPMNDEELAVLQRAYLQCPSKAFHDKADILEQGMD